MLDHTKREKGISRDPGAFAKEEHREQNEY